MIPWGRGDTKNTLVLSWAVLFKGSGVSVVILMQTSELFKA